MGAMSEREISIREKLMGESYRGLNKTYTMDIANGFFLELEMTTKPDDSGSYMMEAVLCREHFPLKRRWMNLSADEKISDEEIYQYMADLIVIGVCDEEGLGFECLWDLLYPGEIVTICDCCGMPTIGHPRECDGNCDECEFNDDHEHGHMGFGGYEYIPQ